ncbi:MAG: hypothetical protein AB8B86_17370 [Pseudomonadales bacterium]
MRALFVSLVAIAPVSAQAHTLESVSSIIVHELLHLMPMVIPAVLLCALLRVAFRK